MADPREPRLDDMADVEALLREISTEDRELDTPPADLWDAIAAEVLDVDDASAPPAEVIPIGRRWARPSVLLAAAAAVVVLVVGIVGVTTLGDDDGPVVVASAELVYEEGVFDEHGAVSAASVVLLDDEGAFAIEFEDSDLTDPPDEAADLELWLIEPDAEGAVADLVSLGTVDLDDPGTHRVPGDVDPSTFLVVDISVEPRDGDVTHSGRSILRAPLEFTA